MEIRDALFHAIEKDFRDGVELILKHNPCLGMKIVGNNYFFPPDISPYRYAAWKNKYEMLKILYKYGHRLKVGTRFIYLTIKIIYKKHTNQFLFDNNCFL